MIDPALLNYRRNVQPKVERNSKGELIYVFADGSWQYFYEWLVTSTKQQFNTYDKIRYMEKDAS